MPLDVAARWDKANTSTPALKKEALAAKIIHALSLYDGNDMDFVAVKNRAIATVGMTNTKVIRGLMPGEENDPLGEAFVTLEILDYPHRKKFYLYFTYLTGGKGTPDWYASKLTHVEKDGQPVKSWSII